MASALILLPMESTSSLGARTFLKRGELEKKVVVSKMEITATDDKTYETSYYSLDAIIASNLLL